MVRDRGFGLRPESDPWSAFSQSWALASHFAATAPFRGRRVVSLSVIAALSPGSGLGPRTERTSESVPRVGEWTSEGRATDEQAGTGEAVGRAAGKTAPRAQSFGDPPVPGPALAFGSCGASQVIPLL